MSGRPELAPWLSCPPTISAEGSDPLSSPTLLRDHSPAALLIVSQERLALFIFSQGSQWTCGGAENGFRVCIVSGRGEPLPVLVRMKWVSSDEPL